MGRRLPTSKSTRRDFPRAAALRLRPALKASKDADLGRDQGHEGQHGALLGVLLLRVLVQREPLLLRRFLLRRKVLLRRWVDRSRVPAMPLRGRPMLHGGAWLL